MLVKSRLSRKYTLSGRVAISVGGGAVVESFFLAKKGMARRTLTTAKQFASLQACHGAAGQPHKNTARGRPPPLHSSSESSRTVAFWLGKACRADATRLVCNADHWIIFGINTLMGCDATDSHCKFEAC